MLQDAARPPRQSCVGANDLENKETGTLYGAQELHMTARTPIMWNFILGEYVYIYIFIYSKYVSIYVVHIVECAGFIKSPQATGPHSVEIRTALAQHRKVWGTQGIPAPTDSFGALGEPDTLLARPMSLAETPSTVF
jgi:hypothetical protein